jgi:hypothetical protein
MKPEDLFEGPIAYGRTSAQAVTYESVLPLPLRGSSTKHYFPWRVIY